MAFTSFNFLIFFPLTVLACYLTPARNRWITLLLASYFFYININPVYAVLTAGITLSTYFFARWMEQSGSDKGRRRLMITNILLILMPLFFFKYFGAINNVLMSLLTGIGLRWPLPEISLILPVGISFYTFMAIGYTVDVYNEEVKAERNPGILALFISFFPLVLSGPIERSGNMLPQFRNIGRIEYSNLTTGLKMMVWGYFMKLVVADRLGLYVDVVYNNIAHHNGTSLLFASLLHPIQVYGDFGGYSLIALGTARILGFNVMVNFNRPFFSVSIAELWRRWHISLIKWLTDYIYTPLAFSMRRKGMTGIVIALLITFLISGIWHGAQWTFIIWGLMQGIFLSIEAVTNRKRISLESKYGLNKKPYYIIFNIVLTYILFTSSLIFSRSETVQDALLIYQKIFTAAGPLYIEKTTLIYSLMGVLMLFLKDFTDEYFHGRFEFFANSSIYVRFASYIAVIFIILLTGVLNGGQFIYFQF
jgi:D-alanyl-lipoteichoic acid acyltransferase DltB (MBOAT superfamily)